MEAKVKATGEIGIVANINLLFGNKGYRYQSDEVEIIDSHAEVDTGNDTEIDYWTRLEHQAAIGAMQAYIIASHISQFSFCEGDMKDCKSMAHALVEKLKGKEERK